MLRVYFRYFVCTLGLLAAAGCTKISDCQSDYEQQHFEKAIATCQQHYLLRQDLASLNSWIESLGQLARYSELRHAPSKIENQIHRAKAHTISAKYEFKRNNLDAAEEYYQAAADAFRQANMQSELAKVLHQLYFTAWQRSEHRKAIGFASESLKAARLSGEDTDEIVALNDLFTIFQEVGNLGPAQQALSLIKSKLGNDQSSGRRINAYISQGLLDMDKSQFGLASHNFDSALAIAKDSKNRDALRGLYLNIVESNLALGRMEKAKVHLENAWRYARSDGSHSFALLFYQSQYHYLSKEYQQSYDALITALNTEDLPIVWSWRMHYWAGQAARNLNNHSVAIASFTRSIKSSESLRDEMALSELKAHSIARRRQPYEALFVEHYDAGNTLDAFTIVEKAKSRSFTDSLIQSSESAISDGTHPLPFDAVSGRVQSLQLYLRSMRATSTVVIKDSNKVVSALKNEHIVSFFIAQRRLFALRVAKETVEISEIDVDYTKLLNLVNMHRQKPDNQVILNTLGELLFPENILPKAGKHLYVSPDVLIGNISVSSLRIGSEYLIERNTVSLIPSANSIVSGIVVPNQTDKELQFVVLGDPLSDLPSANREAIAVSNILGTKAYVEQSASIDNILKVPFPDVLHLATHSGINHLGPWLRLSDGEISGSELLRKNITPRLAVLASCASAVGNDNHIWGSLGGLFLAKGTPSVLASFRSIEDQYASDFMLEFYAQLKRHYSSAEALAFSQRKAIKRGESPQLWGSFVLFGTPLHLF